MIKNNDNKLEIIIINLNNNETKSDINLQNF